MLSLTPWARNAMSEATENELREVCKDYEIWVLARSAKGPYIAMDAYARVIADHVNVKHDVREAVCGLLDMIDRDKWTPEDVVTVADQSGLL